MEKVTTFDSQKCKQVPLLDSEIDSRRSNSNGNLIDQLFESFLFSDGNCVICPQIWLCIDQWIQLFRCTFTKFKFVVGGFVILFIWIVCSRSSFCILEHVDNALFWMISYTRYECMRKLFLGDNSF